jgi:hypothetical protein
MKKFALAFLVSAVFGCISCKEDTSKTEQPLSPAENSGPPTESKRNNESIQDSPKTATPQKTAADTSKTSITVGSQGASVKTKRGTGVSVGNKGVNVESKKVKIDIKKDTTY